MDDDSEVCLGLGLGLGLPEYAPKRDNPRKNNKRVIFLDLGTPVHSSDYRFGTGSGSGSGSSLKIVGERDDKHDSRSNSFSTGNNSTDSSRRKLRLTTEQITLLEESFKQHSTLNIIQKQALAEKLNIKPRQVEVWFQNRRARTKQKQTEVDCKFLTKKCEKLSEENKRLKRELLELRSTMSVKNRPPQPPRQASVSQPQQFFYHIPEVVPITPCEKIGRARGGVVKMEGVAAATTEVVHGPKP